MPGIPHPQHQLLVALIITFQKVHNKIKSETNLNMQNNDGTRRAGHEIYTLLYAFSTKSLQEYDKHKYGLQQ